MHYLKALFTRHSAGTPQLEPQAGRDQVRNSAGGYVYALAPMDRVDRFLILGTEGGTYYADERELTVANAVHLADLVRTRGVEVVDRIVAISSSGRAPKVSPAIFALAMCAGFGDDATRALALGTGLRAVCRTGSHLLEFASYIKQFRGWGRGLRSGIHAWYDNKTLSELAYQTVKYQNRSGYTHRDLLRQSHPAAVDEGRRALYAWIARGTLPEDEPDLAIVTAFERAKRLEAAELETCVALVREAGLPREAVPSIWLREPAVWDALLETMPMTAMIRNLATMTRVGLLTPKSDATRMVVGRLRDRARLERARIHPIAVLSALETYRGGQSVRGSGMWTPVDAIVEALDDTFYLAFDSVVPSGARMLIGLDVSGSMGSGSIAGVRGLTPRAASVAMAMTHLKTEEQVRVMGFTQSFVPIDLPREARLKQATDLVTGLPFDRTDCAQPMLYALEHHLAIDTFVIYTDNETWAGTIHPDEALRRYREVTGIPAKLVTVGMTATGFTIANPDDAGMLDVVGFDASAPSVIADFSKPHALA